MKEERVTEPFSPNEKVGNSDRTYLFSRFWGIEKSYQGNPDAKI